MTRVQREVLAEMDRRESIAARAFWATVARIYGRAVVRRIEPLVEAGDADGIMRELRIDEAEFGEFVETTRAAYLSAGTTEAARLGAKQLRVTFNIRNPRAEVWLAQYSSQLVTEIISGQREAIRQMLASGLAQGRNPRNVALDVVGRMSGGRRRGGVIGLTSRQSGFVSNMATELRDPNAMANYFTRARRDRRFDSIVQRAIRQGRSVSEANINKMTARYADRLLQYRGEVIARTEMLQSTGAARNEALYQMIDAGLPPERATKFWRSARDTRVRDTHEDMNGQDVPSDKPFVSPSGARLMFPGDRSLGAGASEIIQCRCAHEVKIDFIGLAGG